MKKQSKLILMSIALTMALIVSACGSSNANSDSEDSNEAEITFKMNIAYSGGLYEDLMTDTAEKVEELSDGRIQPEIIASGTMGSERELGEAVQLGTLDMTFLSDNVAETLTKDIGWAFLPYLISDYDEADEYYLQGWIRDTIGEKLEENQLIPLASYENGFRNYASTNKAVESMSDFKGQKVRVPEQADLLRYFELAGALSVGITGSEVLTALEQGTIDAVDNTVYNFEANGYADALEYITMLDYQYTANTIVVSPSFWETLTEEDQEIIREAAEYASEKHTKERREREKETIEKFKEDGIEFIEPSPEFEAQMKEIGDQIWDEFEDQYDEEIMKKLKEDFR